MKKRILLPMFFCLLTFCIGINDAKADVSINSMKNDVDNKRAVLACEYVSGGEMQVSIYYQFSAISETNTAIGNWYIYYNKKGSIYSIRESGKKNALTGNDWLHYKVFKNSFTETQEQNFTCPKLAFLDFEWEDEVCFADSGTCGSRFASDAYPLKETYSTNEAIDIYTKIKREMDILATDEQSVEQFKTLNETGSALEFLDTFIRNREIESLKSEYSFGTAQKMPSFIQNYVNSYEIPEATLSLLKSRAKVLVREEQTQGTITEEKAEEIVQKIDQATYETVFKKPASSGIETEIREGEGCNAVFGDTLTKVIKALFRFVQYLGPILVAVLSITDFLKAALSGDPGDMKKASNKLVKRVVAAVLLFFIPIICNMIFEFGGITLPEFCLD